MLDKYVSIILPVKNAELYIKECIDSILIQTYSEFELLIIDDSDDNTINVINGYLDRRIKYKYFKGNISQKINYGIKIASYDLIARIDADDYINPEKIKKQVDFLSKHSDIDIVGTNFYIIDSKSKIIMAKTFPEKDEEIKFLMPIITSVLHSTILLNKKIILDIGGYNENLNYAEDTDLFIRLLGFAKFHNIQENLYFYRVNHKKFDDSYVSLVYNIGFDYLKKIQGLSKSDNKINYQIALLEYYKGDIARARKILLNLLIYSDYNKTNLLRYLIPAILGNILIKYFRKNGIFSFMNKIIFRFLRYDTNNPKMK